MIFGTLAFPISSLVSIDSLMHDYTTPGCGAHLRYTGLEPAVALLPAL